MYSRFKLAIKYCRFYLSASNGKGHGVHSPFVFDFITKVLINNFKFEDYNRVEVLRHQLLRDKTELEVEDFGAGSFQRSQRLRSISSIARNAAKPKKYAQLLYRIVKYYQPQTIVELGTSLGISTCYFSLANPVATIYTLEGSEAIAAVAKNVFEITGCSNAKQIIGNFDNSLPNVIDQISTVDFCFLDGNHRKIPTEKYFQQLLSKKNNNSVFVLDDIHWSKEMEAAWEEIQKHPQVRCTIDLFFIGLVFFKKEFSERQHFKIKF